MITNVPINVSVECRDVCECLGVRLSGYGLGSYAALKLESLERLRVVILSEAIAVRRNVRTGKTRKREITRLRKSGEG